MAVDLRTALAAVLGVGLGALLIAYPELAIRAHTAGRVPPDRRGEYGDDMTASTKLRRIVRILGLVALAIGAYLGVTLLG